MGSTGMREVRTRETERETQRENVCVKEGEKERDPPQLVDQRFGENERRGVLN